MFSYGDAKFFDVNFAPADGKKVIYDSISLSANNPHIAKVLLEKYINNINAVVLNKNKQELVILKNKFSRDLSDDASKLESNAKEQLKREINAIVFALSQSKSMNISEPVANLPAEINNTTMYLLGSKALAAKLAVLQTSEPVLPNRYFEIQRQLKVLNSINITSIEGKSFTYIDEPSEPVIKDKPKKMIILMLGAILGMVMSCIGILIYCRNDGNN